MHVEVNVCIFCAKKETTCTLFESANVLWYVWCRYILESTFHVAVLGKTWLCSLKERFCNVHSMF